MHRTCRAAVGIAAGSIVPGSSRPRCERDLERVEEHAVRIGRVYHYSLVVPVLGIIALALRAVPERAALGTLHESPACAAVRGHPGANLAARGLAAATVIVTDNRLNLGIDVIRVARRDCNIDSAELIAGIDVNKGRTAPGIHRCSSRIRAASNLITKHEPIGIACDCSETRAAASSHRGAVDAVGTVQAQIVLHGRCESTSPNRCDDTRGPASHICQLQACYALALSIKVVSRTRARPVNA